MRVFPVVAAAVLAGGAALLILNDPRGAPRVSAPGPEPLPPPPPPGPPRRVSTTGVLVLRVAAADGSKLPAGTVAGYAQPGKSPRVRTAGPDGTYRFLDAPLGELTVLAEANGYLRTETKVVVMAGIPEEKVLLLTPREDAPK